jgi:Tetratricopeptide repeat/Glycosyltransferase family 9 (heptosyltransferase)
VTGHERAPTRRVGTPAEAVRDAVSLQLAGRLNEAEAIYAAVLAVDAGHFDSLHNLSLIRRHQGRLSEALALILRACETDPSSAQANDSLGNTLVRLNRPEEAIRCYQRAIALKPDFVEAYSNLAGALAALNRPREAIAQYRRALAYKPDHPEVQYYESLEHLRLGNFDQGWRQYEWRWLRRDAAPFRRNFVQPLWLGAESLDGKTILLHADQGIGCTLQFIRYLPMVARQAAKVVLEVQRPLVPLLKRMTDAAAVCARGDPLPPFDRHCPLLSLPLASGTTVETIPAQVPYLAAPPTDRARWAAIGSEPGPMRIGLVWAGNKGHSNDYNRSVPLRCLLPLLRLPETRFVSLQKELRDGDDRILNEMNVLRIGEGLQDFADTAAVVSQLDLVITVDTAVAHLAGALGKPVWIMLSFSADWRWFLDRADSPFYPTARLFRQTAIDDWDGVVLSVSQALNQTLNQAMNAAARRAD